MEGRVTNFDWWLGIGQHDVLVVIILRQPSVGWRIEGLRVENMSALIADKRVHRLTAFFTKVDWNCQKRATFSSGFGADPRTRLDLSAPPSSCLRFLDDAAAARGTDVPAANPRGAWVLRPDVLTGGVPTASPLGAAPVAGGSPDTLPSAGVNGAKLPDRPVGSESPEGMLWLAGGRGTSSCR